MSKWNYLNPTCLTLSFKHHSSAFYLHDLSHHLISNHLCAVIYVIVVAWHSPHSEEQGCKSSRVISRVHCFQCTDTWTTVCIAHQSKSHEGKQKPGLAWTLQEELGKFPVSSLSLILFLSISRQESLSLRTSFLPHDFFPLVIL